MMKQFGSLGWSTAAYPLLALVALSPTDQEIPMAQLMTCFRPLGPDSSSREGFVLKQCHVMIP
jgi:hypothetical protein